MMLILYGLIYDVDIIWVDILNDIYVDIDPLNILVLLHGFVH